MSSVSGRRFGKRYAHSVPVDLHLSGGRKRIAATDVSRHGMFLAIDAPPAWNHAIFLTVHLPAGSFETMATVAHRVADEGHGTPGAGVKFFCMASAAKERWDAFISRLEGEEISLTPREGVAEDSASFLVQLDRPQEMLEFFHRHVASGRVVHVTPPVRRLGAEVLLVLVHPDTFGEFVFAATVVELDPEMPLRMGIRFEEVSELQRAEFTRFVGVAPDRSSGSARDEPVLLPAARRRWTEYAFFSPKLKGARVEHGRSATTAASHRAAAPAPPRPVATAPATPADRSGVGTDPADFDLVVGEPLDEPGLELVDRDQLFDFNWRNDRS